MIGYLRMDSAPADLVLAELSDSGNLVIAKELSWLCIYTGLISMVLLEILNLDKVTN